MMEYSNTGILLKDIETKAEQQTTALNNEVDLKLHASKIAKSLYGAIIILGLISMALQIVYYTIDDLKYISGLFNLDKEMNIPTLFSVAILFYSSVLFYLIYKSKKLSADKFKMHWLILSILFALISADEFLALHEQTSRYLWNIAGGFRFAWILPGTLFVILFGINYLKFFFNLDYRWRIRFVLSAAIYLFGTLGMEFLDGLFQMKYGQENLTYSLLTNIEEMFEMAGIAFLIHTLLLYMHIHAEKITIKVKVD